MSFIHSLLIQYELQRNLTCACAAAAAPAAAAT
jgi:hypothetical protein